MTIFDRLDAATDLRSEMKRYIRQHFGDLLGEHVRLLDEPGGLDRLADLMRRGAIGRQL